MALDISQFNLSNSGQCISHDADGGTFRIISPQRAQECVYEAAL